MLVKRPGSAVRAAQRGNRTRNEVSAAIRARSARIVRTHRRRVARRTVQCFVLHTLVCSVDYINSVVLLACHEFARGQSSSVPPVCFDCCENRNRACVIWRVNLVRIVVEFAFNKGATCKHGLKICGVQFAIDVDVIVRPRILPKMYVLYRCGKGL